MSDTPSDVSIQADKLIKDYAYGSSLTGFIPVPLLDTISLIYVQRHMLYRLSKLYGIPFSKNMAKALISTLMTGMTTTIASGVVGSSLKVLPGFGTAVGSASMAAMGGTSTYALGKVFQQHFESGGTLENFDAEAARTDFNQQLKKGQAMATDNESTK